MKRSKKKIKEIAALINEKNELDYLFALREHYRIVFKNGNDDESFLMWIEQRLEEKKTRIYYDSLKKALINYDTDNIMYEEKGDGELNLCAILEGTETWDTGAKYTIHDFMNELEIINYELMGI